MSPRLGSNETTVRGRETLPRSGRGCGVVKSNPEKPTGVLLAPIRGKARISRGVAWPPGPASW